MREAHKIVVDLSAFVRNGSILPRASGALDIPLQHTDVVKFKSPTNLERSFTLPSGREVTGMGIPEGITLIVGGGFHVSREQDQNTVTLTKAIGQVDDA